MLTGMDRSNRKHQRQVLGDRPNPGMKDERCGYNLIRQLKSLRSLLIFQKTVEAARIGDRLETDSTIDIVPAEQGSSIWGINQMSEQPTRCLQGSEPRMRSPLNATMTAKNCPRSWSKERRVRSDEAVIETINFS
jgi:hypothetical protein